VSDTPAGAGDDSEIVVANEFAVVVVKKVLTRNGERLSIRCPRSGTELQLDPLELESLTWQAPETISKFLETPGRGRLEDTNLSVIRPE
jgi:hypothetical protein